MLSFLAAMLGLSLLINLVLFLIAFRYRTAKLTDASYALTFIVLVLYALSQAPLNAYRAVLAVMIVLWALRLGSFLLVRVWHTGTDHRFDAMRTHFWKFGKFWAGQAIAVWVILLPGLLALHHGQGSIRSLTVVAAAVWLIGLLIEATADLQKYRFSASHNNKDQWIATGIWRYSRHPNYFGEITVWLGVYLYACTSLTQIDAVVGAAGPLFITGLLLFVSGVPILEKSADARWGKLPAYKDYKRRTSILFPLPPKKP